MRLSSVIQRIFHKFRKKPHKRDGKHIVLDVKSVVHGTKIKIGD